MSGAAFIALSGLLPLVWGFLLSRVLARIDARRRRFVAPDRPGSDYVI